jgi:hypothetical protein
MQGLAVAARKTPEIPRSLYIDGVNANTTTPVAQSERADIFRGVHKGRLVALKRYRIARGGSDKGLDVGPCHILVAQMYTDRCIMTATCPTGDYAKPARTRQSAPLPWHISDSSNLEAITLCCLPLDGSRRCDQIPATAGSHPSGISENSDLFLPSDPNLV